ncbi:MAG: hypothetical protein LQ346_007482 [Caloplaca aetnensis]|nr:MAG: hypothetical protein LQ346_007482 [Caloplaca aetnensis]
MFESTYTAWAIVAGLAVVWHYHIESVVPRPYLDEFFHVQQAELYLQGRFSEWHPKITTPPGLYLVSLIYLGFLSVSRIIDKVHVADLRRTNVAAAGLLPFHVWFVLHEIVARYYGFQAEDDILPSIWSMIELNHAILNICLFPPLFFFYGLYYTDVWSVLAVLTTFQFYYRKWNKPMVAAGVASLLFRQTNIFWVAIYLGASEVVRRLKRGRPEGVVTVLDVMEGSWQHSCVYNPLISQAHFEDYIKFGLSLLSVSVKEIYQLFPHLKPYFGILAAFGFFVVWNGGVVLGDKENHVASIHLAQMLYIWPYIMFFSFPLLYPYILQAFVPQKYIPPPLRSGSTRHQLPRPIVAIPVMAVMLLIVHFNTIVHPFTLADNRHYTFYVFRLLFRHPSIKYLAVPIYFLCAWAAVTGLGGLPNVQPPTDPQANVPQSGAHRGNPRQSEVRRGDRVRLPPASYSHPHMQPGHRVSTAVIWLIATALSVVTAPLVEPRYFIIPWLVWRLHMPSPWPTGEEAALKRKKRAGTLGARMKAVFYGKHDHRLWLETAWFLFVNWAVGYVFLHRGFEWPQEKGKVQRFMW